MINAPQIYCINYLILLSKKGPVGKGMVSRLGMLSLVLNIEFLVSVECLGVLWK